MKRDDMIFIITRRTGYIPQLNLAGPIVYPYKVPAKKAYELVSSGVEVYRVDPVTRNTILLTVQNVYDDNIFTEKEKVEEAVKSSVKVGTLESAPSSNAPAITLVPPVTPAVSQMVVGQTTTAEELSDEEDPEADDKIDDETEDITEEVTEEIPVVEEEPVETAPVQQPRQNNQQNYNQKNGKNGKKK